MRPAHAAAITTTLLLTACSANLDLATSPLLDEHHATIDGIPVEWRIVETQPAPAPAGLTAYSLGHCTITLAEAFATDPRLAAHEFGHCVDAHHLAWDHNGWTDEGCRWNTYSCDPAEGYATAWSFAYTDACGAALAPLGLPPLPGEPTSPCQLPDPRSVTP